jgi:phenylalanyl-tRNA synthetase beta chain
LPKALYLFEIEAWSRDDERATEFEPISRFPAVRRDLSIIVTESVSAAHCLSVVQEAAGRHLRNLELLDVYRGQGIDSGKKSFTLGLIFQALSSTLTDDEVDGAVVRVLDALREHVGGSLRK